MPISLTELRVVEIIRPVDSGATRPVQCRLEDDLVYAVKGRSALARGLLGELYAAHLGQGLSLPIPSFTIAQMPNSLLESHYDAGVKSSLGTGTLFGSLWREPVEGLKPSYLPVMPKRLMALIYVFDHWIQNGDRTLTEHGGNANLLVDLADKSLIVIDHNLAFMPSYGPDELLVHACRGAWLDLRSDLVFKGEVKRRMLDAMTALVSLEAELPEDWLEQEPDFVPYVTATLGRVGSDEFWAELG